jgi:hypothetical protein
MLITITIIVIMIIIKNVTIGLINNTFKPNKVYKVTRIKLYNTLAPPVLLYGSETLTVKSKDKS